MGCSISGGPREYLDVLYDEYHRFDVQQTTVGINPDEFGALEDHPDGVSIRLRIEGEEGILAVPDRREWTLPSGVLAREPVPAAIAELAEEQTGLQCSIEGLERVSLVCLQCEVTDESVWTLSALFAATPTAGSPDEGLVWREAPLDPTPTVQLS